MFKIKKTYLGPSITQLKLYFKISKLLYYVFIFYVIFFIINFIILVILTSIKLLIGPCGIYFMLHLIQDINQNFQYDLPIPFYDSHEDVPDNNKLPLNILSMSSNIKNPSSIDELIESRKWSSSEHRLSVPKRSLNVNIIEISESSYIDKKLSEWDILEVKKEVWVVRPSENGSNSYLPPHKSSLRLLDATISYIPEKTSFKVCVYSTGNKFLATTEIYDSVGDGNIHNLDKLWLFYDKNKCLDPIIKLKYQIGGFQTESKVLQFKPNTQIAYKWKLDHEYANYEYAIPKYSKKD